MSIEKGQWEEWKSNDITKAMFSYLEDRKMEYLEGLGNDAFEGALRDKVVGRVQAYNDLQLMD